MADLDITQRNPDPASKLARSEYYQRLQAEIRERHTKSQQQDQADELEHRQEINDKKVQKVETKSEPSVVEKLLSIKDEVQLHSWQKDAVGRWDVQTPGEAMPTSTDLKNDGLKILRIMGYKIDLSDKVTHLKQSYMQNVMQSKSHNRFLATYAQFKVGFMGQWLALMGVSTDELETLRKKAVSAGKKENIKLMEENIYNRELTLLVHGNTRKVRKSLALFNEVQQQLIQQMRNMGDEGYYVPTTVKEMQLVQAKKILSEFRDEQSALTYQQTFIAQEMVL